MKEQLVTFETAKLAKEKGFDPECILCDHAFGTFDGLFKRKTLACRNAMIFSRWINDSEKISAPTQSLLQKWLREKHGIHVTPDLSVYNISGYYVRIDSYDTKKQEVKSHFHSEDKGIVFDTYEQALEKGLIEALNKI